MTLPRQNIYDVPPVDRGGRGIIGIRPECGCITFIDTWPEDDFERSLQEAAEFGRRVEVLPVREAVAKFKEKDFCENCARGRHAKP